MKKNNKVKKTSSKANLLPSKKKLKTVHIEDKSRKVSSLYEAIFEDSRDAIFVSDHDSRFVKVNQAACRLTGFTKQELLQMRIPDLHESQDLQAYLLFYDKIMSGEEIVTRAKILKKDGKKVDTEFNNKRLIIDDVYYMYTSASDITERKKVEEELRDSEEIFRVIFENMVDGVSIYIEDADPFKRKLFDCNQQYANMAGRSRKELLQRGNTFGLQKAVDDPIYINRVESISQGIVYRGSFSWIRPDGKENVIEYLGMPIIWRGKSCTIGIDRDITERKRVETELYASMEAKRNFSERLTILSKTTTELSKAESLDELCRRAVEFSRERLHFDRTSIWFVTEDSTTIQGTFGVDVDGRITDEREERISVNSDLDFWPVIQGQVPLLRITDAQLALKGQNVGKGMHVYAGLFDGNSVIGYLSIDNLLRQQPFSDSDCEIIRLYGSAVGHLCSLKRAEEKLLKEQDLMNILMDTVPDHIYFKDKDSRFIRMNKDHANKFHLSDPSLAVGKTDFDFFTEEHARLAFEDEQTIISTGKPIINKEEKETFPDGRVSWVSTSKMPMRDVDGNIIGTFGVSRDITDRKKVEEAFLDNERKLAETNKMLQLVMDSIPVRIFWKDKNLNYLGCNRLFAEDAGRKTPEELIGDNDYNMGWSEHAEFYRNDDMEVIQSEKPKLSYEEIQPKPDGSQIWIRTSKIPLLNIDNQIIGILGTYEDITESKKAQETLNRERILLHTIIDNLPAAVYAKDLDGRKILANRADVKNAGAHNEKEILNKTDWEVFPKEIAAQFFADDQTVILSGQPVINREELMENVNGLRHWQLTSKLPLKNENGNIVGLIGIGHDITERKHAEEALNNERTLLRTIIDLIPDAVYVKDIKGRKTLANTKEIQLSGKNKEDEVIGKTDFDIYPMSEAKRSNDEDQTVLHSGKPLLNIENRFVDHDGQVHWLLGAKVPLRDVHGRITGIVGVSHNITELKCTEMELIKAKEKAEGSDKLKSEFLAQMSHEIRTPLNSIMGNVDYLNESIGKEIDSNAYDCFDGINLASRRIIRTVDLILNASELQTSGYKPHFEEVDLHSEILNKLYQEHQLSAKQKGLDIIYTCKDKDIKVIADAFSLMQIFANLIDNAIKYTKKGKVEILLGKKNETDTTMVEIKDTGIGIGKEFLPRIFEPFVQEEQGYTRSYDGNGLGLALVKKYCEINNVILEVESEKNVGTAFRIIFDNKISEA